MKRILALDIGQKRTGVAVTDTQQIIATGLTTIETNKIEEFIKNYLQTEDIETIVVGYPKNMNYQNSEAVKYIEPVFNRLKKVFKDINFEYYDERFTSVIAKKSIMDAGAKMMKRRDKALVDKVSATLILQAYMDNKSFKL